MPAPSGAPGMDFDVERLGRRKRTGSDPAPALDHMADLDLPRIRLPPWSNPPGCACAYVGIEACESELVALGLCTQFTWREPVSNVNRVHCTSSSGLCAQKLPAFRVHLLMLLVCGVVLQGQESIEVCMSGCK